MVNLSLNPTCANNVTDWPGPSWQRVTGQSVGDTGRTTCARFSMGAPAWQGIGGAGGIAASSGTTGGRTFSYVAWVRTSTQRAYRHYLARYSAASSSSFVDTFSPAVDITLPANTWTKIRGTGTCPTGGTYVRIAIHSDLTASGTAGNLDIGAVRIVEGNVPNLEFVDGDSPGYAWTGTPGNSTTEEQSEIGVDAGTDPFTVTDSASAEVTVEASDALEFTEDVAVGIPIERADSLEVDEEAHADAETGPGDTAGVSETTSFDAELGVADTTELVEGSHATADLDAGTDPLTVDDDTWITNVAEDELAVSEDTRFRADLRVGDQWTLAEGAAVESLYADLAISFYGVDPVTGKLTPLPDFTRLSISPQRNGPGSITVEYPVTGLNFDWLYAHTIGRDADLEVEIWSFGSAVGALRGYLQEASGDAVEESKTWTYAGRTAEMRMADARIAPAPLVGELTLGENIGVKRSTVTQAQWDRLLGLGYRPNNDADPVLTVPEKVVDAVRANAVSIPVLADPRRELKFAAASPGEIVITLLNQARARGTLTDITTDATASHDSDGNPWPELLTTKYSPHTRYDAVLDKLTGDGRIEWALAWTGSARVLKLWVAGKRGVDRTTGLKPVVLRAGRNLIESPHKWSVKDSVTHMFAAGSQGVYSRAASPDAAARRYRQVEGATSSSALEQADAVTAYAQHQLSIAVDGTLEVDHSLGFLPGEPRPLVAFDIGDWVYSQTGTEFDRYRVVQWSLTVDANRNQSGIVVLNDAHTDSAVRQRQQLDALAGGDTVVGTSTPPTDTGVPVAPAGVVVGSDAFTESDGVTRSAVTVAWAAVTMNTDASAATDIDGYRVQWRPVTQSAWMIAGDTDSLQLSFTTAPAATIRVRVQAVDRNGNRSEWSGEVGHVTDDDTTPPGVPSQPAVTDYLGTLAIAWDGNTDAGADMIASYRDFAFVEVHVSPGSNFTPDASTLVGTLYGRGRWVVTDLPYDVTQFVRLVALDRRRNASAPSVQGSAVPGKVVGDDVFAGAIGTAQLANAGVKNAQIDNLAVNDAKIGSVGVGKLVAGTMTAAMTVSGIIRTATSGSRVELDTTGFRCVNSAGQNVLVYSISSGEMTMTGTFRTGQPGQKRGELSGSNGSLRFYPDNDNTRWGAVESFIPAGYPNAVAIQLASSSEQGVASRGYVQCAPGVVSLGLSGGNVPGNSFSEVLLNQDFVNLSIRSGNAARTPSGGALVLTRHSGGGQVAGLFADHPTQGLKARIQLHSDGYAFFGNNGANSAAGYVVITASGAAQLVSNGQVKSFVIDHPDDPDRWLVHGCTESPTAGVEYTGTVTVTDRATVELPDYFESLVEPDGRTVQLTVVDDYQPEIPRVAAGPVWSGRFTVRTDSSWPVRVHWHVRGTRRDTAFEVEPRRADYVAHGDGPYRYLTPKENAV